ncbi:Agamous-like MADS-box protein [Hirschfeldia incana]|nr:Agamous-like MADS-box protein [Hirschfeldia incana]
MRREMKVKRRELKKKKKKEKTVRVLCDFCGSSSNRYEHTQEDEEEDETLLIESELKRLRLLTRRMTGKDLDGLTFAELILLESLLKQVKLIVQKLRKKTKLEEEERLRNNNQRKEAVDEGEGSGSTRRQLPVLAPCNSSGEKQEDEAPPLSQAQIAYERRSSESIYSEFERLWLLKERMNGRELAGMTSAELLVLEDEINRGLKGLYDQKFGPRMEQIATQHSEKFVVELRDVEEKLGSLPPEPPEPRRQG